MGEGRTPETLEQGRKKKGRKGKRLGEESGQKAVPCTWQEGRRGRGDLKKGGETNNLKNHLRLGGKVTAIPMAGARRRRGEKRHRTAGGGPALYPPRRKSRPQRRGNTAWEKDTRIS